jgi:tetratricopeptide (TPR) repeat protein
MRQHRLAVRGYTEAVRLDPRNTQLLIDDRTTAIGLEPKVADHHASRGRLYLRNNAYALAIADFDESIRLDRTLALAYINRGMAWKILGDKSRALADFKAAVELQPDLEIAVLHRKEMEGSGPGPRRGIDRVVSRPLSASDEIKSGLNDFGLTRFLYANGYLSPGSNPRTCFARKRYKAQF